MKKNVAQDVLFCIVWLAAVLIFNRSLNEPSTFMLLYAIPVFFISWRRGVSYGIVVAGLAVAIGAISGSIHSDKVYDGHFISEIIFAFSQLTVVSLSVRLAKRIVF
ncbi:hypothetical protein QPM17_22915 [Marinobacter sp. TBZ242]|uniref:MASE1 protein n=1 Tax=Marinobacter azerbaijanicus TaxID=3050455 RepID=A0ABT7IIJ5_9GAMM|nr:hypothetical protein [Marinobacter sp. TBZ242]MDL0433997.1 hypothetical protein [Marinobacter sp. TBZ242]